MSFNPEAAAILRAAARTIQRDGWTPYNNGSTTGQPNCAVGTIIVVTHEYELPEFHEIALDALRAHAGTRALGSWNDAQPSAESVIVALCAAASEIDVP